MDWREAYFAVGLVSLRRVKDVTRRSLGTTCGVIGFASGRLKVGEEKMGSIRYDRATRRYSDDRRMINGRSSLTFAGQARRESEVLQSRINQDSDSSAWIEVPHIRRA